MITTTAPTVLLREAAVDCEHVSILNFRWKNNPRTAQDRERRKEEKESSFLNLKRRKQERERKEGNNRTTKSMGVGLNGELDALRVLDDVLVRREGGDDPLGQERVDLLGRSADETLGVEPARRGKHSGRPK